MSESNNTNDLDSYGVWVKTPPKTVDSSAASAATETDSFNLDTDLPDFSDLDVVDDSLNDTAEYDNNDTALSAEELSAIAGVTSDLDSAQEENSDITSFDDFNSLSASDESAGASGEEEISLDEFIEGGVFETGPDENKIKEKEAEASSTDSTETEDVSLEDFGVSSDSEEDNLEASVASEESTDSSDDDLFNIDLSFDDEPAAASAESGFAAQDFSAADPVPSDDAPAGTEDVDLSEFGLDDFSSDTQVSDETQASDDGMETVDLSEFGFEDSDDNSSPAAEAAPEPVAEEPAEDDGFTVEADEEKPLEADEISAATPESDFTAPDDNDFDVDALLGDVTDENGNTVSIGNPEEHIVREIEDIPSEDTEPAVESEEIEDFSTLSEPVLSQEEEVSIPDTFDEETSSFLDDTSEGSDSETTEFADSIKAPILDEMESSEEQPSTQMTAIFSQIVGELSSLKDEIASLKNDLAGLKTNNNFAAASESVPAAEQNEDLGFFANTDEDDAITLSTDELDNILNIADFTEETAEAEPEAAVDNSDLDISDEEEIEPASELPVEDLLGNVDNDIEVPEDDFDNNLTLEETADTEPELDNLNFSAPIEEESDLPEEISVPKDEDILVESSSTDLMGSTEEDPFADLTRDDPPITDTLTDEKLDYLSETEPVIEEEPASAPISEDLTSEIKSVLSYMDQLLENLPEDKIAEFAQSEQFDTYKKLFKELGLA